MRALWIDDWDGPLRLGERPDPEPGPHEVLIEVEACAIGLTVLNCIRGDLGSDPADLPRVPGHELVGRIAGVGAGVEPSRLGERVAAYFYLFCGRCERCLAAEEPLCLNLGGYVGVSRDGGYAERATLPERNAIPIPEGIDPVAAAAIPDAIATPVHVAHRARIALGERVAVIAAGGGLGVHMVQAARLCGGEVVGLESDQGKRGFLDRELGVEAIDSTEFAAARLPATWAGADVIVDFLGSRASLEWAQAALAPNGRLVVLTTFPGVDFRADPRTLVFREGQVLGSRYASRQELMLAARLVERGQIRPIVSKSVGPEEVERVHDSLRAGVLLGRGCLRWAPGTQGRLDARPAGGT